MPTGLIGIADGYVSNQVQLLSAIDDELDVFNRFTPRFLDELCFEVTQETTRVYQGAGSFDNYAEGTNADRQRGQRRVITTPLHAYQRMTEWSKIGIRSVREEEIRQEIDAAMAADMEKRLGLFFYQMFTKRTVTTVDTAARTAFYNGELDVPNYGNNTFEGVAHYHYLGLNTTTLAKSHIDACVEDIAEHGYEGPYYAFFNPAQESDVMALFNPASGVPFGTAMAQRAIDMGFHTTGVVYNGCEFVFTAMVPSGYFAVVERSKFMNKRVDLLSEYRGLVMSRGGDYNNPMVGAEWLRTIGFSVRHLGAGTCRQLVGSTTYTNPTFASRLRPAA